MTLNNLSSDNKKNARKHLRRGLEILDVQIDTPHIITLPKGAVKARDKHFQQAIYYLGVKD